MPQLLDLDKLCAGLSRTWRGYLFDWDRTLRAANKPETTRYNYLLAASQLAAYLAEHSPDTEAEEAADDPCEVTKAHCEAFQAWMIETRSASTALNKHKTLKVFFNWLCLDEEAIDRSPMQRVSKPEVPEKLIPIIPAASTEQLLAGCNGKEFIQLRDKAIIMLFADTGARLAEIALLELDDVDLNIDVIRVVGKGNKQRAIPIQPGTARAVSRYLRARDKRKGADLMTRVWLADRGSKPLAPNGIKIMVKRRGQRAGIDGLHAHLWRHLFAHEWLSNGGGENALMQLTGWSSRSMVDHYAKSAAGERAVDAKRQMDALRR